MGIGSFTAARAGFVAAALAACSGPALAASFHYASSSNRIYVEGGGSAATLSDIKAALPSAPLDLVSTSPKVWLLRATLQIVDGTELDLHGTGIGGDVDELRILSNNDGSGVVHITADYGTVNIDTTKITSWDANANGPDTNDTNGRAYINVRSSLAGDGVTAQESRMDIASSEIQYLGYNAAESYGLVWKVNGYTGSNPEIFDQVQVWGDISNSHIHHNHYGVYTFGHQDGVWSGNEVDHNTGYGFDPHDDTDNLLIEGNDVHDNGNHGIIASKRCDHIIIRNNQSYHNTGNGIMLHRSSNDGLVDGNQSHDNTDSGVAIFGTARSTIQNNTLLHNGNAGIRMSMGTTDSVVTGNEIGFSGKYGFYFYRGSDVPEPGSDGRNKRNVFQDNTIHDVAADGIKMTDGDGNKFVDNTFTAVGSRMTFATSRWTELTGNTIPSTVTITLSGTSSVPTDMTVRPLFTTLKFAINDDFGTVRLRDSARGVFDPDQNLFTAITPTSSLLTLTRALIGSTTSVILRRMNATPSGMNVYVNPTLWSTNKAWQAHATSTTGTVAYSVGGLTAGAKYEVKQAGTTIGTFTADSTSRIKFSVKPGTTATLDYTVTKL